MRVKFVEVQLQTTDTVFPIAYRAGIVTVYQRGFMRRVTLTAVFVALVCLASAQEHLLQRDDNVHGTEDIKVLELKVSELVVQADWVALSKLLSSDYVRTLADGHSENREQTMATFQSGEPKIVAMIPEEIEVRIYGDTAISTGKLTLTARQENKVRERHSRFTDVFIRRNGQWFLVATQTTPAGK